ncbi:right-handed parallel beta-helix repeat-containing protein [bacterium]|nr:right-handed parallel beta-helix repeat-containing protein [bacterium]
MKRASTIAGAVLGCLFLVRGPGPEARILPIPAGTGGIGNAVLTAAGGDTLMLTTSGGVYHEPRTVVLPGVPLTIMAGPALSVPPRWTSDDSLHLRVSHDLTIKGIRLDGRGSTAYAIQSHAPEPNTIVVADCEIASFTEDGVTDAGVPVDTCLVRNTVFHDLGKRALNFQTPDMCRNLTVENCTFYRLGTHAVRVSQGTASLRVRIANVTVHDCLGGVYLRDVGDAAVTNSILTGCKLYAVRSSAPATLTHNCTFRNRRNYDLQPGGEGCFNADPRYFDAEAGDFSLLPGSACLTAGRAGEPLGDPRWTGEATRRAWRWHVARTGGRVGGVLLLAAGLVYASFRYVQRRVREQEERKHLRHLSHETIRAQEDERRRLSRELHDQVGQDLVMASIQVEMLRQQLGEAGRAALGPKLDDLSLSVEAAIEHIHQIAYGLRPAMLDELGLVPTLQWYTETFSKRTGLRVHLDVKEMREMRHGRLDMTLYRIVQEALTNVVKHARATQAVIRLSCARNQVTMVVEDDGVGFDVDRVRSFSGGGRGIGLLSVQERVESFGGTFHVASRPGVGTRLMMNLPIPEEAEEGG